MSRDRDASAGAPRIPMERREGGHAVRTQRSTPRCAASGGGRPSETAGGGGGRAPGGLGCVGNLAQPHALKHVGAHHNGARQESISDIAREAPQVWSGVVGTLGPRRRHKARSSTRRGALGASRQGAGGAVSRRIQISVAPASVETPLPACGPPRAAPMDLAKKQPRAVSRRAQLESMLLASG